MNEKYTSLKDGQYPCNATLHIKNGKAVIVINNTFDLPVGTTIPLYREDSNLLIEALSGSEVGFLNGHAII